MAAAESSTAARKRPTIRRNRIIVELTRRGPLHIVLVGLAPLWMAPTLGLGVTSFRSRGDIASSGWWTALAGQRSTSPFALELSPAEPGASIIISAQDSAVFKNAVDGFPNAAVGQVRVIEAQGQLSADGGGDSLALPGIGTVRVSRAGAAHFEADRQFDGYFIIEDAATTAAAFTLEYRLTARQTRQGVIEVDEIDDGRRVPRTGMLTVHADGSYTFERRSSFFGTFEATFDAAALAQRPIPVAYSVVQAGGVLQSFAAGETVTVPLASALSVEPDGSYAFEPQSDFNGTLFAEVDVDYPVFTLDNCRGVPERADLPPPGFVDNFKLSLIITIPSTNLPILLGSLAAGAFVTMAIPPIVFLAFQKYFVRGLTAGAVKG